MTMMKGPIDQHLNTYCISYTLYDIHRVYTIIIIIIIIIITQPT
jgi:hypothetical protein